MQALVAIGCALIISVVMPITQSLVPPKTDVLPPPTTPLIPGAISWKDLSSKHLITAALKDRIDNPTYVPGPSEFFPKDTQKRNRLKFINLTNERAKFIIKTVPSSCFLKFFRFECCIPSPGGSGNVAFEADIEEKTSDPNIARLAPLIPGKLPDIIEFPIPKKTVYVTLTLNNVPIFEDRKMTHYDTFICRDHLSRRGKDINGVRLTCTNLVST